MVYYTYILKSTDDGSFYYGQTKDLRRSLEQFAAKAARHRGKGKKWVLYAYRKFATRYAAVSLELRLKRMKTSREIEECIRRYGFEMPV